MQNGKGVLAGFVAGLVVATGANLLLRDEPAMPASDDARIAALAAQLDRLERGLARLAVPAAGASPDVMTAVSAQPKPEESKPVTEQLHVAASAHQMVDLAIQTGQWTRAQARELAELTSDLPADERDRVMARIAAAINNDQIYPEFP